MLKSLLFLVTAGQLVLASAQTRPYTIKGTIDGKKNGKIYLSYATDHKGTKHVDSGLINDGKFVLKGEVDGVVYATISTTFSADGTRGDDVFTAFMEPGVMQLNLVDGKLAEGTLKGSVVQDNINQLEKQKATIRSKRSPLLNELRKADGDYKAAIAANKDEATLNTIKKRADSLNMAQAMLQLDITNIDINYILQNPNTVTAGILLMNNAPRIPYMQSASIYEKIPASFKNSSLGRILSSTLEDIKKGSPGSIATNFTSTELRGERLSLTDFKGKYVLLDFWATWCVPCRKSNPHLRKLYAQYQRKGFEIIGVSDDDTNVDKWKQAIEVDKIGIWKHILRGLKVDGDKVDISEDVSANYAVYTLPTKILIDPNGMIVGRFVGIRGDQEMDQMLAQIFNKQSINPE
ncbi:TlpA disulfide reductase family protein [Parapedobacter tibetensis]|uniref:TlpA disulfide reductase family protein n=1 Tax=Parapedobacter tibetensis TaxID=2972951 RepID=UPI00214D7244|nr:TlpA disulfide reductase family protein [Parapedobacter tibetensis]